MANPEHLKILKQGVEAWNRWRLTSSVSRPDLSQVNLDGISLQRVNLLGVKLTQASMLNSDLTEANCLSCDLSGSRLGLANLRKGALNGASLANCNLSRADLSEASLRNANLIGATLRGTNLAGADLTEAFFGSTAIGDIDLATAAGLSTTRHLSSSDISTATLQRTAEGLLANPSSRIAVEKFYFNAGVHKRLIGFFHSRPSGPIEFDSSFISYSHADKRFARRLHVQLQAFGIRCWLDEHDLKPGDRILDVVNDAIRLHDRILLCCSKASLNSWWVKDEIRKAQERERRDGRDIIIPLMVDRYLLDGWEDGLAADLRTRLAADFTGWEHHNAKFGEQFERVVKALRTGEAHPTKSDATAPQE